MGAGSIRADRAVNPTLVFNETYANMVAAGSDTLHRIDLNIPSIDATTMSGSISTHRTAINVSGQEPDPGRADHGSLRASRSRSTTAMRLQVAKGGSRDLPDHDRALRAWRTASTRAGSTSFRARAPNRVTIPVAFVKKQGAVTLTQHAARPLSFAAERHRRRRTAPSTVANFSPQSANAALNIAGSTGQEAPVQERRRSRLGRSARVTAFSGAAPSRRRFRRR